MFYIVLTLTALPQDRVYFVESSSPCWSALSSASAVDNEAMGSHE